MAEKVSRKDYISALRAYLDARGAANAFLAEHVAWSWLESGESPPEPKVLTRKALDEFHTLKAKEEQAYKELDRIREVFGDQV